MVGREVGFLDPKISHPWKEPQLPVCKYKWIPVGMVTASAL